MMKRIWKQSLFLLVIVSCVVVFLPDSASASVDPFYAPAETSGSMTVKLHPTENVNTGVSTLVTFGVPFTRGSVTPANLSKIRVLSGSTEIPANVSIQAPWRHITNAGLDGTSVRVALIQIHYTFTSAYPNSTDITVEWGTTTRTQNITEFLEPKTAWHQVVSGTFNAADNIFEPDVYAVLPVSVLSNGVLNPQQMNPMDESIGMARDNAYVMDATEHYPDYDEADYAYKNFFYTVINEDNPAVTANYHNRYKTAGSASETWLYDRSSTMYNLYYRTGSFKALREATRSTEFYASQLWDDTTSPMKAIGLLKLTSTTPTTTGPTRAMYSYNEPLAYDYWLTGNSDMLEPIEWIVNAQELNAPPTRWSNSLGFWTERHPSFRMLSNIIAYEVFGLDIYKDRVVSQTEDYIWHQNGADGAIPTGYVDGGLYHRGSQHSDGVPADFVASSWMTVLAQQSMIRAYSLTQDNDTADFIKRVGHFMKAAIKYDPYHIFDNYSGTLPYADYMMKYDGTSDVDDGKRGTPSQLSSMIEHNLEIATSLLWSEYFNHLRGGSPDTTIPELFNDMYYGYDWGVNNFTRPGHPEIYGSPEYKLHAGTYRKWGWQYKPSASLSWLTNQLGITNQLPPEIVMTSPEPSKVFSAPATIGIETLVTETAASITKVEFFNGATKLGERTSAPYNYTWSNVPAGSYTIKAIATDSNGKTNESISSVLVVDTSGFSNYRVAHINGEFKSYPIGSESGTFTIEMDVKPLASVVDGGVGFSLGSANGDWGIPAVVRFGVAGLIEARDYSSYVSDTTIPYTANEVYHLRIVLNTVAKTYSAYVTPPSSSELTIATNIDFYTIPDSSSLDTLSVMGDIGGMLVGNVSGGSGDITVPSVSITAPAGSSMSGSTTLTASASDASGITEVKLFIDGIQAGNTMTASPYTTTFNAATLTNGSHTITARATDAAGNVAYSAPKVVTVTGGGAVDTTDPSVSMTAPSAGTVSGTITLSANATDAVRVGGVTFHVDDKPITTEVLNAPFSASLNTSSLAAGNHLITAVARDTSGNQATSASVSVNVTDTISPQVVIGTPAAGTIYDTSFQLSAVASDNAGVAGVRFYADGNPIGSEDTTVPYSLTINSGLLSAGTHSLTARARDTSNNTTDSTEVGITFSPDSTAPTVSVTSPAASSTNSGFITLSVTASDNYDVIGVQFKVDGNPLGELLTASPYTMTYNTMALADGSHTFTATATDGGGNVTNSSAVSVTTSNDSGGSGTITYQNGVDNYTYVKDFTLTGQYGGNFNPNKTAVNLGFYNQLQNSSPYTTAAFIRFDDITIPVGTKVDSAKLTLRLSSNKPVTFEGRYLNTYFNYDISTLTWHKRDVLDYWDVPGAFGIGTDLISGKEFSTSLVAGWQVKEITLDPDVVQGWLNDPTSNYGLRLYTEETATVGLINSSDNLTVADRPKLSITYSPTVADTTDPTVSVTSPAASAALSGTVNLTASASDNVGVVGVQFKFNGIAAGAEDTVAPYAVSYDTSLLTPGSYTVTAEARDAANNTTDSTGVSVTVTATPDTTDPTVSITSPAASATLSGTVNLTATASDNVGVVGVQFKFNGVAAGAEDTVAPYAVSYDTSLLTPGSYTVTAVARDAANNTTDSTGVSVTVSASGGSGTVTFQNGVDNYTSAKDYAVTSNGGGNINAIKEHEDLSVYNQPTYQDASFIRFDNIAIPANTQVVSAKLTMRMYSNVNPMTVEGRYLNVHFDYDDALTWNKRSANDFWNTPGAFGDGTDTISGESFTTTLVAGWQVKEIPLDPDIVQGWLTNPSSNYGVKLYSDLESNIGRMNSSNNATISYRPELSITYSSTSTDTTDPTVSITSPVASATLSGTVNLTATASDNVGVVGVQFKFNGVAAGAEDTVAPYAVSYDTSLLTPGSYTVTAVARDAANNTTDSTGVSVTVSASGGSGTVTFQEGVNGYSGMNDYAVSSLGHDANKTHQDLFFWNQMQQTIPYINVAFIRFDGITIPSNMEVDSAKLTLRMYSSASSMTVEGRYVNAYVDYAADLDWTHRGVTDLWNTPGAYGVGTDLIAGKSFTTSLVSGWQTKEITLDPDVVQGWLTNPSSNYGVKMYTDLQNTTGKMNSSNNPTISYRPELSITYSPITTSPGTVTFQNGVDNYTSAKDYAVTSAGGYANKTHEDLSVYNQPAYQDASFIRFDDIAIPANTQVVSAKLTMRMYSNVNPMTVQGRYLNVHFDYDDALTWNKRSASDFWDTPGAFGDGTDTISGESFTTTLVAGWQVKEITLDPDIVQGWLTNPSSNYGVKLYSDLQPNIGRMNSSNNTNVSYRPELSITYE